MALRAHHSERSARPSRRLSPTARIPTIALMPFVESCICCASIAPLPDAAERADWIVLLSRGGELLGVACVGCLADEDLLVLELEDSLAVA
jgi:hypothetical protein